MGYATKRCVWCGKTGIVGVDENELFAYLRGNSAQESFKSLTVGFREQIISGTHPECWDAMWANEEADAGYDRLREES
jgi:hypothetical protein